MIIPPIVNFLQNWLFRIILLQPDNKFAEKIKKVVRYAKRFSKNRQKNSGKIPEFLMGW